MIVVTHHWPDGTPCAAHCDVCIGSPWQPSPYAQSDEMINSFRDYLRLHLRQRIIPPVPPPATYGANSPYSRGRRGH